jgi:undecaprenyl diphosphate synthase
MGTAPRHVAIILDGNGRWAARRNLPRGAGHRAGAKILPQLLRWAQDSAIEVLSLFCFSTENWKRPPKEVSGLMGLFAAMLRRNFRRGLRENVRLRWLGQPDGLPAPLVETLRALERDTAPCDGLQLCLAINYSGRDEAVRALQRAVASGISCQSWEDLSRHLDTAGLPDVDLLIRTSGEQRISNFLPLQSAYAELYFTDCLWPDFSREELQRALDAYGARRRRFGAAE